MLTNGLFAFWTSTVFKIDVLSAYPTTFMLATILKENEVVFMFRGFAVDKIKVARMHVGVNTRASVLLLCMNAQCL